MRQNEKDVRALGQALIAECERRLFDESLPRLKKCLALLAEEEIWFRPNNETVSVGNLVLHLCGNVRQWILSGLGGAADGRQRAQEFSAAGPLPTSQLLHLLDATMTDAKTVLQHLEPGSLSTVHPVQGFQESAVGILVHVVEHFSYHTGQIAYFVKARKGVDLGFYRGINLGKIGATTVQ